VTSARRLEIIAPYAVVLAFFLLWEAVCRLGRVESFVVPAPSVVIAELWKFRSAILMHAVQTTWTAFAGFALAVVFGVMLGGLVGYSRLAYAALYPALVGFNSVPKAALVPVLVIWFGIGSVPAVLTAFLISFFPITANVATGLATVEPELQDVLRALGASKLEIFLKVGLPRSLPYFFASLKIAITLAFVGVVVSEISGSNAGVGYMMTSASASFNYPLVFAGLMVLAALGIAFYALFAVLERRLTGWAYRGKA
jgi:NitT/TauT family transport system permease protein